jgi:hypothetical protein
VPAPLNDVADKTPVLGTKDNLVDDVLAGLLPVEFAAITGYQTAADDVLSVIPIFVAFVAFVALPADPALPSIETPVRLCDADPRFNAMAVVPM